MPCCLLYKGLLVRKVSGSLKQLTFFCISLTGESETGWVFDCITRDKDYKILYSSVVLVFLWVVCLKMNKVKDCGLLRDRAIFLASLWAYFVLGSFQGLFLCFAVLFVCTLSFLSVWLVLC